MDISLKDLTKLFSPKYTLAFLVASTFLLFAPAVMLVEMGLHEFVRSSRQWIGVVWLCSAALLLALPLISIGAFVKNHVASGLLVRLYKRNLKNLTVSEKRLLLAFLVMETKTLELDVASGVVSGLVQKGVLYRSSGVGHLCLRTGGSFMFAHNIQDWAYIYLNEHPDLLSVPAGTDLWPLAPADLDRLALERPHRLAETN